MELRQHGVLAPVEQHIAGAVEGICVAVDTVNLLATFTVPSVSDDLLYGPAPYGTPTAPAAGARILVVFASNGRPWIAGWTNQL